LTPNVEVVAVNRSVQQVAGEVHDDPAYLAYAQRLDALLAEYQVAAIPRFVDVEVERRPGVRTRLPTFVMESGTGTPVLFLNGSPATSAVWVPMLGSLTGVRAIVVDRPGHGLTGEFDYAGVADVRAHAVAFLDTLLEELGLDRVVVAGNSLGGLWGLWLAIDRPHRVSALALPGLPPGLLTNRVPAIFGLLSVPWIGWLMRRLQPPSRRSTRRMFTMMGDPPATLSDAFVDAYTHGQRLPNVEGGTIHLIHHVRFPGRLSAPWWLDAETLAGISQPTLFLAGAQDFLGGLAVARAMADAVPGAELAEVGVGHLPWLQDPHGAATAIEQLVRRTAAVPPEH
jgi:2-hydroxy-6-oxonona-2,4-dienedioate hydrolase